MDKKASGVLDVVDWLWDILKGFWTVVIGMGITISHFVKRPVTMHYPDEKWEVAPSFRGQIKCDVEKCIACEICSKTCPISCITVIGKREEGKPTKICTQFQVDHSKCMHCGLCVESCPKHAVFHSQDYEFAQISRKDLLVDYCLVGHQVKNPAAGP